MSHVVGLEQRRRGEGPVGTERVALGLFTVPSRGATLSTREFRQSHDEAAQDSAGKYKSTLTGGRR